MARPPSDAVVALRSLGRRYRGLFAGLEESEKPDDLAHRVGEAGRSALDHVAAATRTIATHRRALDQILVQDDPALDPEATDTAERVSEEQPGGTVEERLAELQIDAQAMADRADRVHAADWDRTGRRDDGATVTASSVLWEAVDDAIAHLKAAEATLAEVRGR